MVHLNSHCLLGQAYAKSHAMEKNFKEPENNTCVGGTTAHVPYFILLKGM